MLRDWTPPFAGFFPYYLSLAESGLNGVRCLFGSAASATRRFRVTVDGGTPRNHDSHRRIRQGPILMPSWRKPHNSAAARPSRHAGRDALWPPLAAGRSALKVARPQHGSPSIGPTASPPSNSSRQKTAPMHHRRTRHRTGPRSGAQSGSMLAGQAAPSWIAWSGNETETICAA
jgi:hypothetical protein